MEFPTNKINDYILNFVNCLLFNIIYVAEGANSKIFWSFRYFSICPFQFVSDGCKVWIYSVLFEIYFFEMFIGAMFPTFKFFPFQNKSKTKHPLYSYISMFSLYLSLHIFHYI